MSIEVRIICDGCNAVHPIHGWTRGAGRLQAHQLRTWLKEKLGWSVARPHGQDLCPECHRQRLQEGKR